MKSNVWLYKRYLCYETILFPMLVWLIYIGLSKYNVDLFSSLKYIFISFIISIVIESFVLYEKDKDYNIKRVLVLLISLFITTFFIWFYQNFNIIYYLWVYIIFAISNYLVANLEIIQTDVEEKKSDYFAITIISLLTIFFFVLF